jgi:predicted acyltransferase
LIDTDLTEPEKAVNSPASNSVAGRQTSPVAAASERMLSVDALRGFAMFWLIGGQTLIEAFIVWTGNAAMLAWSNREMAHPVWSGFHWEDVIMPTFIFISGVTIPLSVTRRLERGEAKSRIYLRLLQRLVLLQILNVIMYGALQHLDWHQTRFGGVLARIGWSYFFAALIVMHTSPRRQFIWAVGILLGYWAAMTLIPVPGAGTGLMTPDGNLAGYIDRSFIPGILFGELYEREGLFATLPTVTTVLMGALAGHWLLSKRKGSVKVIGLITAGILSRLLGELWTLSMPINTKMWTPSLVLAAGGWSLILLGLFYLVIDVWGFRKWSSFFVVIGMNSILIYVLHGPIDFDHAGKFLFHGLVSFAPKNFQPVLTAFLVLVGVKWLLLWFLHRKRIFVRA